MHVDSKHPRLLGRYDYSARFRVFEIASMGLFAVCAGAFSLRLAGRFGAMSPDEIPTLGALALLSYVTVDFLSGLVHFLCDNLGSSDTPLVGQKFIKSFRDHHLDPGAMTRGDIVTVNADNVAVSLPVLVPATLWLDAGRFFHLAWFLATFVAFVAVTNQAHKWAHMSHPPKLAVMLQSWLLLSPRNHATHHQGSHDQNYCITSGMLNPLLNRIGFWPRLLRLLRRTRRQGRPRG